MSELTDILLLHAERYPMMQPQDAVKLIYQNEFGCEHLMNDSSGMLDFLKQEIAETVGQKIERSWDEIGNGVVRLHLAKIQEDQSTAVVTAMKQTAAGHIGTQTGFQAKLEEMKKLCRCGKLPFDEQTLNSWLASYSGGAVHHSALFRQQYHPAYRVMLRKAAESIVNAE